MQDLTLDRRVLLEGILCTTACPASVSSAAVLHVLCNKNIDVQDYQLGTY